MSPKGKGETPPIKKGIRRLREVDEMGVRGGVLGVDKVSEVARSADEREHSRLDLP